jgi:hypothetical protein
VYDRFLNRSASDEQNFLMAEQALPAFFCPVSCMIMHDPVCTADGQTYERSSIEEWLRLNNTSPLTGALLSHKGLSPNIALRQAIEEWEEKYCMHVKRSNIEINEPPMASGAFKTVYRGWLRTAAKRLPVAVMKLRAGSCATEAHTFLKLGRHPRLVRFMGRCIDGGNDLLLTELAQHGSLSDAFEKLEGKMTMAHAIVMMHQVRLLFCVCA